MMKWWIGGWLLCVVLFLAFMRRAGQRTAVLAPVRSTKPHADRADDGKANTHKETVS